MKDINFIENNIEVSRMEIQNRVISLKYLGESSTGEQFITLLKITQIKDNFIGLAHDHGSNLSGHRIGLVGQLKAEFKEQKFSILWILVIA